MMKKIHQVLKKKPKAVKKPTRITNETIAEHRERVLAEGKRFKYPVQYTKNKLVFNAALVGILAVIIFILFCWWQLYKVQSTADFFYRLTRIIPVSVATIDEKDVSYGDYLLNYRTSEVYLNTVESTDTVDGKQDTTKYDYYKVQAMDNAVADAYADKIAGEKQITVTDKDVDEAIDTARQAASSQGTVSQNVFDRSVARLYGISPSELRYYLKKRLLRQKVAYAIDDNAQQSADMVKSTLEADADANFDKVVAELNKTVPVKAQVLVSGWVSKDNKDGGVAAAAAKLQKGQFTGPIKPSNGDGYYFVKLLDVNEDGEINYQFIKIPLVEFSNRLQKMYDQHHVRYYITLPEIKTQTIDN